jgi:uncharacterized protein (DUF2141 family)
MKISSCIILILISIIAISCKKKNIIPQPEPVSNQLDSTSNTIDSLSKLVINLSGMQNTNGKVNVALYKSSSTFNNPNQAFRELFLNFTGNSMVISLDSLDQGEYAFALFHDENNNQQLDQNFLSIPTEGFAFSNNAMGSFGPPSWTQSKFIIPKNSTATQTISLNFY